MLDFVFNFHVGTSVRKIASLLDLAKKAESQFGNLPKKGVKRQLEATIFCYYCRFFFFFLISFMCNQIPIFFL